MEGEDKDVEAYFCVLDGVVREIGADAVVGVVRDKARVCVKAGKMVEAAYSNIFRVGCTAHVLDLALEDGYKDTTWMAEVVDAGNKVGKFFTNVDKCDPKLCAGFNIWLYSWMPRDKLKEVNFWAMEGFSTKQAHEQANQQPPTLWWEAFGSKHDLLAPQAIKLLGQTNSFAACERNWSLHELIYARRRRELTPERMAKLVYNSWNVRLVRSNQHGRGVNIHIPWVDDVPMVKEMEEWYADWLKRVQGDVVEEEVVVVMPMMRKMIFDCGVPSSATMRLTRGCVRRRTLFSSVRGSVIQQLECPPFEE
ncbi:hypothetical protein CBR_g47956 [Chara braunii]|uniref:HAT C-terminal dimerisation domain-containing protein n=1 Tax=Chara braunii TaxID=69332 RepID=A0A388M1R8_CHABU|nr:hypothetical protein CBR_g47956 [Chara braunii]|eukprot:GBG88486.1 hypothetical protein CBR_g47956 [Chara braunii]